MIKERKAISASFKIDKARAPRSQSLQVNTKMEMSLVCGRLNQALQNQIERFNEATSVYKWELQRQVEPKKKLEGVKAKPKWKDLHKNFWVTFKLCVPLDYKQIRKNQYEDFVIELEGMNFEMGLNQQRKLQLFLDSEIKSILKEKFPVNVYDGKWLEQLLIKVSNRLIEQPKIQLKRESTGKEADKLIEVDKLRVNQNYMLCPSPVSICWNSEGILCISENRYLPKAKGSYIGNRKYLNNTYEEARTHQKEILEESFLFNDFAIDEPTAEIYNWNIEENLNFIDRDPNPIADYEEEVRQGKKKIKEMKPRVDPNAKKIQKQILVDMSTLSLQISGLYRSYFNKSSAIFEADKGKKESLRLYRIEGSEKQLQNDLLFLIYRINEMKNESIIEVAIKNQIKGYSKIFEKDLEYTEYRIISEILRGKMMKYQQSSAQSFTIYLKGMIVENEIANYTLRNYFKEVLDRLSITKPEYERLSVLNSNLSSYLHFDFKKAEKIFMKLLELVHKHNALKPNEKLAVKNGGNKRYISTKNVYIPAFSPLFILTDKQSMQFCRKIIPILQIRSRNNTCLEYRTIMRITLANDQLKNFITIINKIIAYQSANDPNHKEFIKEILERYRAENKDLQEQETPNSRRHFKIECFNCKSVVFTYELEDVKCNKCLASG